MVNRRREEVNIPGVPDGVRRLGAVPEVGQVSAAPIARIGGGRTDVRPERLEPSAEPQVWDTARASLEVVSHELGKIADKAAVAEGDRAGKLAGLDPEFRLKGDLTLYAQAFDRAGLESAKSRISVDLATKMEAAGEKHRANPAALEKELTSIKQGFLSGLDRSLAPDVLPMLETDYNRRRVGLMRAATREMHDRAAAEMRGQLQDHVTVLARTAEQQAYRLGLDGEADAVLAGELQALSGRLAQKGPDGKPLVDPAMARKLVRETEGDMVRARIFGTFARLETAEAKAKFVAEIENRYMSGADKVLNTLDPRQYEVIRGHLRSEASKIDAATKVAMKGLEHDINQIRKDAADGIPPSPQFFTTVKAKLSQVGTPDQVEALSDAMAELGVVQQLNTMSPRQVEAIVDAERTRLTKAGGTADGNATAQLRVAEKWLANAHKQLAVDPLGFAERTGVPVPPLDVSSGDKLAETLPGRIAAAQVAAQKFEREPVFLKPEERTALASAAKQGGASLVRVAAGVVKGAGDVAPRILQEIVKDAPEAAMIGKMMLDGASPSAIDDAAKTIELRRDPNFKPAIGQNIEVKEAVAGTYGVALKEMPQTYAAAIATAKAIYDRRHKRGEHATFQKDIFDEALGEALGQVKVNGVQYGGLGTSGAGWLSGGSLTLVPPGTRADSFMDLVGAIRKDDYAVLGTPRDMKGREVSPATLRSATWVSVGTGRYVLELGEVDGQPRRVKTDGDRDYVIDLNKIMPDLRRRRPDLFLEGAAR